MWQQQQYINERVAAATAKIKNWWQKLKKVLKICNEAYLQKNSLV